MNPLPPGPPVYSLKARKALRVVVLVPVAAILLVMLLHHKGFIDIETFGVPETYVYYGGLALILLAIVPAILIWRCPGCGAHLGKQANPTHCPSCGAEFH